MENLGHNELCTYLQSHLSKDVIENLKAQKIGGRSFMFLESADLKLFDFPLGHILEIMKFKEELRTGKRIFIAPLADTQESKQNSPAKSQDKTSRVDDILLQFLPQKIVDSTSDYEKDNMMAKIRANERAASMNLPTVSNPLKCYLPIGNTGDSEEKEDTQSKKKSSKNCRNQSKPSKRVTRSEGQATLHKKPAENPKSKRANTLFQVVVTASSPKSDIEISDCESESADKEKNHRVDSFKPADLPKTSEELTALSPHLPSFNIEEMLTKHDKAKNLVPSLKDGLCLAEKDRKLCFRALMKHLCFKFVKHPNEVTSNKREGLAKSLVCTYTQYQKPFSVPGKTPWSHIYDSKPSGHFANIMKRIQTNLPSEERPRKSLAKRRKVTSARTPTTEVDIVSLAILNPGSSKEEKSQILYGMEKSFELRNHERKQGESITTIIQKYPHLTSYGGELINREFKMICPTAVDMCPTLVGFVPKILAKWGNIRTNPITTKDSTIKACMVLASKLPHSIAAPPATAQDGIIPHLPVESELIIFIKPGVDLQQLVEERRKVVASAVQPYLIGVQGIVTTDVLKYFLVLDSNMVDLRRVQSARAIDSLFKCFWVFNVKYTDTWANFFRFLQTCLYKIFHSGEDDAPPSAVQLFNVLNSS